MADRHEKKYAGTDLDGLLCTQEKTKTESRSLINRNISVIVREREVEILQVKEEKDLKD